MPWNLGSKHQNCLPTSLQTLISSPRSRIRGLIAAVPAELLQVSHFSQPASPTGRGKRLGVRCERERCVSLGTHAAHMMQSAAAPHVRPGQARRGAEPGESSKQAKTFVRSVVQVRHQGGRAIRSPARTLKKKKRVREANHASFQSPGRIKDHDDPRDEQPTNERTTTIVASGRDIAAVGKSGEDVRWSRWLEGGGESGVY